jgi:hypothetical protein
MATPGVGQDIEDICTRCGDTWHVVVAKVGERVVKVVCKLCGSQHNYRGENNGAAAAGGSTTSGGSWGGGRRRRPVKRAAPAAPAAPDFDPSKPPRTYAAAGSYQPGERIVHPSFGTGVVASSPGPGKVDVVFPSGARTLACAKAASTLERPTAVANVPIADRPPAHDAEAVEGGLVDGAAKVPQHN